MYVCAFFACLFFGDLPLNEIALAALVILGIGGIASVFHLQTPTRFFNAFSNLKSHLTQEALLTPFLGIALLVAGLDGLAYHLGPATLIVDTAAMLLAVAFLVCTGLAYQMGSRPTWNTPLIVTLFLLTAFETGSVAVLFVYLLLYGATHALVVVFALCAYTCCFAVQFAYLSRMKNVGYGVNVHASKGAYRPTYLVWLISGVVLTGLLLAVAAISSSAVIALFAALASTLGAASWTVLFFKGAHKVKMFPMYDVDLNLDM